MREKDSPSLDHSNRTFLAHGPSTSMISSEKGKLDGVASMWNEVVTRLERSVDDDLGSDDSSRVLRAIQSLRQFAVASTMNKTVVGNSTVLRPRLLQLLGRFVWWSTQEKKVCADLCGLINSLVRDCAALSEHILSRPDILNQLMKVILDSETDAQLREIILLLFRSLFGAEELSSVLFSSTMVPSKKTAALNLFTDTTLRTLLGFIRVGTPSHQPLSSTPAVSVLTNSARCWLVELLALLATDSSLAVRLHRLGVIQVCHQVILCTACKHSGPSSPVCSTTSIKPTQNRVACAAASDPANQLAVRFALKLMAHVLFHVEDALEVFKTVYQETDPFKLVACYGHLTGAVPPSEPQVCYELPPSCRSQRLGETRTRTRIVSVSTNQQQGIRTESPTNTPHRVIPVSAYVPSAHGTQAFLGLVRGLIYWRLTTDSQKRNSNVEAVDQFGNHVASANGIGMSADDIALLIIQPLTEGCLYIEDTRILSWICHVLVLVLDQRTELHLWTVYTNSFIREMDSRVTSLIKAVQAALDGRNHVQFIEHLIPMVKLFACLASGSETIRALFSDLTVCGKLIDFAVNLRSLGAEHFNLVREFQYSIAILLHVLSRSFSAHHSFFRQESCSRYLLQLINDNLLDACRGHSLCAGLVEAASSALVNVLLPRSPLRQDSHPLMDACLTVLIRLITVSASPRSASPTNGTDLPLTNNQIETTPDLRVHNLLSPSELRIMLLRLRLNGIWGLVNLLHDASAVTCTQVFEHLVEDEVWLDLLRPITSQNTGWTDTQPTRGPLTARRCSTGSIYRHQIPESKPNKHRTRSMIVPDSSIRDPMFYPPASVTPPHEQAPCSSAPGLTARLKRASSEKPVTPKFIGDCVGQPNGPDSQLHRLLLHKTLMFLHNLLRHEKVIDSIVKEHWWNITQLLISVLEGNHPPAVKEQAVLVLSHLANGPNARKELHRNEDLIEKLKLFMRSSDSHIKAAALTATYNLLALGHDNMDSDGSFGSSRTHSDPFLSHQWRLHHRHHRHKDRRRRNMETHSLSTSGTEGVGSSGRRDVATCVAQSALQEAEEELDEEEQDVVLEHTVVNETRPMQLHGALDPVSYRSLQTNEVSTVEDSTVSFAVDRTEPSSSNATPSNRRRSAYQHHPFRQWWQLSPASAAQVDRAECSSLSMVNSSTMQSRSLTTDAAIRSLSISSTSSSTSSTSCAEDLASTVVQVAELDRSTAQDICGNSSTSCSEAELNFTSPTTDPQTQDDATMVDALVLDACAPLAAQEAMDESGSQSVQLTRVYSAHGTAQSATGQRPDWSESSDVRKDASCSPLSPRHQPWFGPARQQLVCPRRSRRDLETGFRQILLPFLQELESDQLLRNTWDWLMLRANTRGKPVQLHHLFVAWQRLYNTLPSSSLPRTISDTLNIESTLFSNCVTVDAFLKRLKDSANPTCSTSLLAAIPRHRDVRHHRRRHHHCHRHQAHVHSRHSTTCSESVAQNDVDTSMSTTSIPPVTAEEVEHTDDLVSDEQNRQI